MISFFHIRKFLLMMSLIVAVSTATAFGFAPRNDWAATGAMVLGTQPPTQIAWGWGQAKATVKGMEGQAQEAIGNVTGDPKDQVMGRAKQAEGQVRNAAADLQDNVGLQGRAKAVERNLEGKLQESNGNTASNARDEVMGRAKQVESQILHITEDLKDKGRDLIN